MADEPEPVVGKIETIAYPTSFHRIRFMFADGGLVDVITAITDSRVNEFAFGHHYGHKTGSKNDNHKFDRIVGWTDLGEEFSFTPEVDGG